MINLNQGERRTPLTAALWRSMTGWGKGQAQSSCGAFSVEVRSVNHRHLDISIKAPRSFAAIESRIRQRIRQRFERGRFDVFVTNSQELSQERSLQLDLGLAKGYLKSLKTLKDSLELPGEITLDTLARLREIFPLEEKEPDPEGAWETFQPALDSALGALESMRSHEGAALMKDVDARLAAAKALIVAIQAAAPVGVERWRERLRQRLEELFQGQTNLDPGRLEQEVLYLTQRSDVTEELTRLMGHIAQFEVQIGQGSPGGRKLDFLLQEMHREISTLGAKTPDSSVSAHVVEVKGELEKIREQVQNLE